MLRSWLLQAMTPDISLGYMRLDSAHAIWDAVSQTYSEGGCDAQIYELKCRIQATTQQGKMLETYFNSLQALWQELDYYQPCDMKCSNDTAALKKRIEKECTFEFLAGLNPDLDQVRTQVLGKDPFPSLREVYAYVRAQALRRSAMVIPPSLEGSALISTANHSVWAPPVHQSSSSAAVSSGNVAKSSKSDDKDALKCDYCHQTKHVREQCFKLNGYPPWWPGKKGEKAEGSKGGGGKGGRSSSRAYHTSSSDQNDQTTSQLSSAQMEKIVQECARLLSDKGSKGASGSLATSSGNFGCCLSASGKSFSDSWIIDTGATDHMTSKLDFFSRYSSPSKTCVTTADGSPTLVVGEGSDQRTGATIGRGSEKGGLYLLDDPAGYTSSPTVHALQSATDSSRDIWLWHKRLGHPSFIYLQKLFPSLLSSVDLSQFKCEICELAKHHRVSYPLSINKSYAPFALVHSDVWGPSRVSNLSNSKWFVTFINDYSRLTWVYLMTDKSEVFSIFQSFHQMIHTQYNSNIKVFRSDNGGEYINSGLKTYFSDHGIIYQRSCSYTPQQNGVAERKNRHILEVARSLLLSMSVPKSYWGEAVLTAAYLINRMPSQVLKFQTPLQVFTAACSTSTVNHLPPRVFGCISFVHLHHSGKLDPHSLKCIFLGYSATQKGYKCYHPPSKKFFVTRDVTFHEEHAYFSHLSSKTSLQGENISSEDKSYGVPMFELEKIEQNESEKNDTGREGNSLTLPPVGHRMSPYDLVYTKRDKVLFQRNDQSAAPVTGNSEVEFVEPSCSLLENNPINSVPSIDNELPIALRRPLRSCPSKYKYPISNFMSSHRLSPCLKSFAYQLSSVSIPQTLQDALDNPKWKEAMYEELRALRKNSTWELVELPRGKKVVGCKWVFTIKHKADGSVDRYKARLVAKGYTQTYGIDYQDTFALVAKMNTIRVLLSLAANLGWTLQQFDVKNAFLHGDLEEEVYMDMPPGIDETSQGKVCRLRKSLYGLKQSPRAWFGRFSQAMKKYGYRPSQADHTLFLRHSRDGRITIVIVYVDDIIMTGDDIEEISKLKIQLAKEFDVKDLGTLRYFLGIEVAHSKEGIFISQTKYVLDLLTETGMLACKPADSPIEQNHRLGEQTDDTRVDRGRYQRLVGKLIYLAHTRPDIAYAVSVVSQFMHEPCEVHMQAVERILRYLKSAPGKGLLFSKHDNFAIEAYTDADWAGSVSDRRSTTGYCTFVGGNLVTWRSKKQSVVARSSAEAEFRAMAHGYFATHAILKVMREIGPISELTEENGRRRRRRRKGNLSNRIFSWGNLYTQIGAFIESTSYTQRVLKESVPPIFQSTEAFQTTMVGSMKTRGKTAAMAKSATAQSHSTHGPAIDMVAPPPFLTAPATVAEHGGTSYQGGLVTTADLGPVLEQLQAIPSLPPRSTYAPAHTSNETLARVQLGSTHFSPPDPRSQADLSLRVDQLAQRMDDQSDLMRQLLNQIILAQNLGLGQLGEGRRIDERTGRQLNGYPAGQAGVGRQGEGQQLDRSTDMSQASASPTRCRLSSRNKMRERLGPRLDVHARLGPQGNGGQSDNHRNEDREERRSAVHSQTNIHERLRPQGGQPNPHNEDHEEGRSAAHSRRDGSRRQATENLSQAQSTNTPPSQCRREGRPLQTQEEVSQRRPNREGRQHDRPAMCMEDFEKLMNDRLRDLKTGGNLEDALRKEIDQANSTPFTAEIEQAAPLKRFSTPSFTHFKGDSDPESHLKHFKSVMILHKADDALMCKVFVVTLRGAAQDWFHTLPSGSINSFKELAYVFTKECTSYRTIKKNPDHLDSKQKKPTIVGCDNRITSSAFKKGLPAEHDLYRELTITPSQTLAEVYATAERYALWDDDRITAKKSTKQEDQPTKRAGQRSDGFSNKNKDKRRSHPQGDVAAGENYTKFTIPIHQILAQVKNKPWVRRPPPLKGDPNKRDTSKYCAFHGTHRHTTNNCLAWKAHLEELVKEGHCTEFIVKQAIQRIEDRDTAKEPPQKVIRINTILADAKESGLTSKEKKRKIKQATMISQVSTDLPPAEDDPIIGFQKKDLIGVDIPHNDAFVISIQIAQAMVDRIHADEGSAANIL
ncbi:unnamed protein product [Prunus armeniaca]